MERVCPAVWPSREFQLTVSSHVKSGRPRQKYAFPPPILIQPIYHPIGFFLANSTWRTDIVTFCRYVERLIDLVFIEILCSHARIDSVLGNARITHIQARKSRRLPFLHEYLLVFFTAAGDQRFVMRIDRLGKVGFTSAGIQDQPIAGTNVAIQEVGVYHVQDSHNALGDEGPWLEMDGIWGSHPVATLVTWEHMGIENPSHHVRTAAGGPQRPRLRDVSRLLEAILLEMPS